MTIAKTLAAAALAAGTLAAAAAPASAEHGHFVMRTDRNGETHCRYIAQGQTSKQAGDPGGHQFHDNVHTGQPGSDEHGTDFDKSEHEDERCDHVEERGSRGQGPGR